MHDVRMGVLRVELWVSVLRTPAGASRATAWGVVLVRLEGRGSGGECVCVGGRGATRRSGTGGPWTLVRAVVVDVDVSVLVSFSVEGADAAMFFGGDMDECLQSGERRAGGVERGVAGRRERVSDGVGRRVGEGRGGHGPVLRQRRARCRRRRRGVVGRSRGWDWRRRRVDESVDRAGFLGVSHSAWLVRRSGLVVWTEQRCDGHPLRGHRRRRDRVRTRTQIELALESKCDYFPTLRCTQHAHVQQDIATPSTRRPRTAIRNDERRRTHVPSRDIHLQPGLTVSRSSIHSTPALLQASDSSSRCFFQADTRPTSAPL
ncbi:hypothetical protein F5141DRAFT_43023 [Pisolithus sp. B1]|nr:hypothetical protein F5141DRAFT_43023 [Pisolithus sp. B1]